MSVSTREQSEPLTRDQVLEHLRDGWSLYERRDCVAYVIRDGQTRKPVPFTLAVKLREEGVVVPAGPSRRVLKC